MQNRLLSYSVLLLSAAFFIGASPKNSAQQAPKNLQNGDIIFQTTQQGQGIAIQLATHSIYTHCGLVYQENGKTLVLEAVQPVKITPFSEFVARGDGGKYTVKRLKNATKTLTPAAFETMKTAGKALIGKDYDLAFGWSDDKIYCSELVWKLYKKATGLEVGKLQKLRDFDLKSPVVQKIMQQRYGADIPYNETVIAPSSIFESGLLETVE
jgi:uncharacterized protein YycO